MRCERASLSILEQPSAANLRSRVKALEGRIVVVNFNARMLIVWLASYRIITRLRGDEICRDYCGRGESVGKDGNQSGGKEERWVQLIGPQSPHHTFKFEVLR